MTTTKRTKKSVVRKATVQTIGGATVLWLTAGKLTTAYRLERLDTEIGGVAFQLSKAHQCGDDEPEVYRVLLNGWDTSCTCPGHTFHNHCKHVDSLAALLAAGKV